MEVLELYDKNKDYYVPKSKEEMIILLERYKSLARCIDKGSDEHNKEYYELLYGLINLDISAFSIEFKSHYIPDILREVLKYNAWYITKGVIDKFGNKYVDFSKKENEKGIVSVSNTPVAEIILEPEFRFVTPSINVMCYETDFELAKEKLIELIRRYVALKSELDSYKIDDVLDDLDEINPILYRFLELQDKLNETKKLINMYRKNIVMYKNPLYKEVSYALLEEYRMPNEEGKTYVKSLPWITLRRNSI